jgi:anti-sigma regulatory factor (Ser/Thr protein kinase)
MLEPLVTGMSDPAEGHANKCLPARSTPGGEPRAVLEGRMLRGEGAARARDAVPPWMHSGLLIPRVAASFFSGRFGVWHATPFMARMLARHILNEWCMPPATIDTVLVLVSELVTNAVRHGFPPAPYWHIPEVTMALWRDPELVVLEVSDETEEPPVMRPQSGAQELDGGRGLMIVEALSREWSYYHPRPGRKTVYCIISTHPA